MSLFVIYFQKESKESLNRKRKNEERMKAVEEGLKRKREDWDKREKELYFSEVETDYDDNIQFATSIEQINEILKPLRNRPIFHVAEEGIASCSFRGKDGGKVFWKKV